MIIIESNVTKHVLKERKQFGLTPLLNKDLKDQITIIFKSCLYTSIESSRSIKKF
jgi:hypothetical protein